MIALLIGTVMIIFTVAFHALGSSYWLMFVGARIHRPDREGATTHLFFNVMATATVLLLLHAVEVVFWALLYLLLPGRAGLESLDQALYFSVVTFTTLGYGDITLGQEWQLLAGIEAMAGITVFGLTTALLYAVVQRAWHVSRKQ